MSNRCHTVLRVGIVLTDAMEVQTCTVIRKTVGDVDFNSVTPVCFDRRTYRAKNSSQHGVSDITMACDLVSESVLLALPLRDQYGV